MKKNFVLCSTSKNNFTSPVFLAEISETDIVLKEVVNDMATIKSSGGFQGLSNIDYTLFKVDWCGGIIRSVCVKVMC